ncbi:MAG TPA: hypothetical protein VG122_00600 [Gemmata sp.]|nr:hypothetical protein [Gemmata sp.]
MLAFAFSIATAIAAPVPKEIDEKFEKGVIDARTRSIDFLKRQQKKDGSWEGGGISLLANMEGGETALVTLSLLEAGVPVNDQMIAKAVDYLVKLPRKKTYIVSLQTQVLARVDAKKHKDLIQKDADWLMEQAIRNGDKLEGWSYPANQIADGSNTHFAVVGLHAADQAGAKVDDKVWKQIKDFYVRTKREGGWSYYNIEASDRSTNSMTTCALVGLLIVSKHDKDPKVKGPDPAFEKGLKLLVTWDLQSPKGTGYAMMTVAELGRMSRSNEFRVGDKTWAWYRVGAEKLIKSQKEDGSFILGERNTDAMPLITTASGLYFLGPPTKK